MPPQCLGRSGFPPALLNFSENLLRHRDQQLAVIFRGEDGRRRTLSYSQLYHATAAAAAGLIDFAQLPFEHPLYIMYSSGTTGLPKCMVQSAGGVLLHQLKELLLHTDLNGKTPFSISPPAAG
jgi:acyl-coenzyme A synthetase/AMP-(fatty) acid ligase